MSSRSVRTIITADVSSRSLRDSCRFGIGVSHQVGLDADIWLTPMPNRQLSCNEREETSAVMMVRTDRLDIDPHAWTPTHLAVIRAAALEPSVQRIFVNAAIKKALCREAKGDRHWLHKVRPMYGHDYHFHIRIKCPPGAS